MGVGIFTMHYLGMSALHASAHMIHAPAYRRGQHGGRDRGLGPGALARGRPRRTAAADPLGVAFGIAVSGMHYTAMEGVTLHPHAAAPSTAPALSTDLLAIVVAIVAFGVSAIFLLFLVPDQRARPECALARRADFAGRDAGGARRRSSRAPPAAAAPHRAEAPELGRGGYGPLGGAGGPPRKFARHLPIERDGGTQFVAVEDVVAIHANAHYTYIFNGSEKLFCPLAIGDVEQRLDTDRFIRVHRSHIVNIDARGRAQALRRQRTGRDGRPTTTPCRSAAAGSAR